MFGIAGKTANRHVTTITASSNANAFGADLLEAAQEFGSVQTVLGIAHAPVVVVGALELFAVPGGAAVVRRQVGISFCCEVLRQLIPDISILVFRSAMRVYD